MNSHFKLVSPEPGGCISFNLGKRCRQNSRVLFPWCPKTHYLQQDARTWTKIAMRVAVTVCESPPESYLRCARSKIWSYESFSVNISIWSTGYHEICSITKISHRIIDRTLPFMWNKRVTAWTLDRPSLVTSSSRRDVKWAWCSFVKHEHFTINNIVVSRHHFAVHFCLKSVDNESVSSAISMACRCLNSTIQLWLNCYSRFTECTNSILPFMLQSFFHFLWDLWAILPLTCFIHRLH